MSPLPISTPIEPLIISLVLVQSIKPTPLPFFNLTCLVVPGVEFANGAFISSPVTAHIPDCTVCSISPVVLRVKRSTKDAPFLEPCITQYPCAPLAHVSGRT